MPPTDRHDSPEALPPGGRERRLDSLPSWLAVAVFEATREAFLVLDADLNVLIANPAFYSAFGGSPSETLGRPLAQLHGRIFDSPELLAQLTGVARQGSGFDQFLHSADLPDRGRRILSLNAHPLRPDSLTKGMILLGVDDVTKAQQVAEAQAWLAAIVEDANDAIVSQDLDGTICTWNPAAERMYGYTAAEAVGRHVGLIVPPERREELDAILGRIARGERVDRVETERRRKDGSPVHVALSVSPIRDAAGRIVRASSIAHDVSERRRIEQALREAARRLDDLSSASPAVLYTLAVQADDTLVPTWVSRNMETMVGFSAEEALSPGWWASHVHPDDRADLAARRRELLTRGSLTVEYRVLRADKSVAWIRDALRVVRDAAGRPHHVMGTWTDITERRALEAQLQQAQKMESIGRLAAGVAHDFNNLLAVIIATADLSLQGLRDGDPLAADLKDIQQAAKRGAELTQHLLAFSRRQVFQPTVINLNDLLADLEPMLTRLVGEDIRVAIVPGASVGNVRADRGQLTQVVMNLVVNSRDAMPDGGTITLETANADLDEAYAARHVGMEPGAFVMLAVTDTGVGMDEATRERVFEPFFTTKAPGHGTGLGLSTVYGIVKQSGGSVWVYSEPGVGTTFKIYLPRVAAPATAVTPARLPISTRGTEVIMVVEDDASLREATRRILESAGYVVVTAGTPGEALLTAEHFHGPLHLLLTDVVMPAMRGPELAERISRLHPGTKVLYMSGYPGNGIVQGGALPEGAHFLSKPFDAATLTRQVRATLDADSA